MKDRLRKFRVSVRTGTVARVLIWAAVGMLLATPASRPWPVEVDVRADSDTTVVVTWFSQEEHQYFGCTPPKPVPYDSFELLFQPVGESSWTSVGRTHDTFMVHDPKHFTGRYSVRGWRDGEESWMPEGFYATTEPLHIGPVRLHEVSTGDTSAIGFGYSWYHGGYVFVMNDSTNWSYPDAYVTDYKVGSPGPLLLASPSVALSDPGAHVHNATWHSTWFSAPLPDERSLVPSWEPFTWAQVCSLPYTPLLVACRSEWNHYALIKVLSQEPSSIELEVWYQQTDGLRLTGH